MDSEADKDLSDLLDFSAVSNSLFFYKSSKGTQHLSINSRCLPVYVFELFQSLILFQTAAGKLVPLMP